MSTLSARAARLAAAFEEWPRQTLTLEELWVVFAQADQASATRPSRRADLADALDELAGVGAVVCSKAVERTSLPALPTRLTLPKAAPTPSAAALARSVPWRPELAWAVSARLTLGQVEVLRAVNGWLRDRGHEDDVVPLRERSLEVLGHEKRLDRLLGTSLFGPGRLTLALLRTFRAHPPLPARQLGDGPVLLVLENSDTFDTLARVLSDDPGQVGWVAWGAGGAFEASVASVGELPNVRSVAYFGDVDARGLAIPANAAVIAARDGLPPVVPATGLYELLFAVGRPQPGQPQLSAGDAHERTAWLGPDLARRAEILLRDGTRLAQESVRAEHLRTGRIWRPALDSTVTAG
jgi:hypothetical protein